MDRDLDYFVWSIKSFLNDLGVPPKVFSAYRPKYKHHFIVTYKDLEFEVNTDVWPDIGYALMDVKQELKTMSDKTNIIDNLFEVCAKGGPKLGSKQMFYAALKACDKITGKGLSKATGGEGKPL